MRKACLSAALLAGLVAGRTAVSQQAVDAEAAFLRAIEQNNTGELAELARGSRQFRPDLRLNVGDTPLGVALKLGNVELARLLLENRAAPNLPDAEGWVPLAWAVMGDYPDLAAMLVAAGANTAQAIPSGGSIADLARQIGSPDMIRSLRLPEQAADAAQERLIVAVMTDDATAIAEAVTAGANPNAVDPSGVSLLFGAAALGRPTAVAKLLELGVSPSEPGPDGLTPLMVAARSGNARIVEVLLAAGADPLVRSRQGITALDAARILGDQTLLRAIEIAVARKNPNQGFTLLGAAASRGDLAAVRALLDAGVPPNSLDRSPRALPLNLAAFAGHSDVVLALLAAQGNVNAQDARGVSPTLAAALGGRRDLVSVLVMRGGNPTLADRDGTTVSSVAITQGWGTAFLQSIPSAVLRSEEVRIAIQRGDIDALRVHFSRTVNGVQRSPNDREYLHNGISLLGYAASAGTPEMVQALLAMGADANGQRDQSSSPLHLAAMEGREQMVRDLLAAGANPLLWDNGRRLPHEVAKQGSRSLISVLQTAARTRARDLSRALRSFGYNVPDSDAWNDAKEAELRRFQQRYESYYRPNILEWFNLADRDVVRVCNARAGTADLVEARISSSQPNRAYVNGWYNIESGSCRVIFAKSNGQRDGRAFIQIEEGGAPRLRGTAGSLQFCVSNARMDNVYQEPMQRRTCPERGTRVMTFVPVSLDSTTSGLVIVR